MVHEGNKDAAEECFRAARDSFDQGNLEKAAKLAQKAQRMYPSEKYKGMFIIILFNLKKLVILRAQLEARLYKIFLSASGHQPYWILYSDLTDESL